MTASRAVPKKVCVTVDESLLSAIEDFRQYQRFTDPSLSMAVRQLIELGLQWERERLEGKKPKPELTAMEREQRTAITRRLMQRFGKS